MTRKTRNIAVITGDLVNSTALGREKVERAFAALEDCAETQADWHGAPLHFTRHRGDGWQVVLARPEMALRSALAFRAALRAEGSEFDSYMGIAEGEIDRDVGPDLNDENEVVFRLSGMLLETIKESADVFGKISHLDLRDKADPNKAIQGSLEAAVALADSISQDWTPPMATAVRQVLVPTNRKNLTELGHDLGVSRQAVTKSLNAARYRPLLWALQNIEKERNSDD